MYLKIVENIKDKNSKNKKWKKRYALTSIKWINSFSKRNQEGMLRAFHRKVWSIHWWMNHHRHRRKDSRIHKWSMCKFTITPGCKLESSSSRVQWIAICHRWRLLHCQIFPYPCQAWKMSFDRMQLQWDKEGRASR